MCIESRIVSKRITTKERERRDALVVRELVYPMYLSLAQPKDIIMVVTDVGERKDIDVLLNELEHMIYLR